MIIEVVDVDLALLSEYEAHDQVLVEGDLGLETSCADEVSDLWDVDTCLQNLGADQD